MVFRSKSTFPHANPNKTGTTGILGLKPHTAFLDRKKKLVMLQQTNRSVRWKKCGKREADTPQKKFNEWPLKIIFQHFKIMP